MGVNRLATSPAPRDITGGSWAISPPGGAASAQKGSGTRGAIVMSSKELTQGRRGWAERHRQRVKELRHIVQSGDLNDAQKRDAAGDMMWHFEQAARLDSPGRSSSDEPSSDRQPDAGGSQPIR